MSAGEHCWARGITTTYGYDTAGAIQSDYWVGTLQFGSQLRYGYDSMLRRTNLTNLALGSAVNYGYDAASRLQMVSSPSTLAGQPINVTYTYLADSPLVSQILFRQNGATRMTTTKAYDHLNRLGSISSPICLLFTAICKDNGAPFF